MHFFQMSPETAWHWQVCWHARAFYPALPQKRCLTLLGIERFSISVCSRLTIDFNCLKFNRAFSEFHIDLLNLIVIDFMGSVKPILRWPAVPVNTCTLLPINPLHGKIPWNIWQDINFASPCLHCLCNWPNQFLKQCNTDANISLKFRKSLLVLTA